MTALLILILLGNVAAWCLVRHNDTRARDEVILRGEEFRA